MASTNAPLRTSFHIGAGSLGARNLYASSLAVLTDSTDEMFVTEYVGGLFRTASVETALVWETLMSSAIKM